MMPISFNLTMINTVSLHSRIISSYIDYSSVDPLGKEELDIDMIEKCTRLDFLTPTMIWPYFGNLKLTLSTIDSPSCR